MANPFDVVGRVSAILKYRTLKLVRTENLKVGYFVDGRPAGKQYCGAVVEVIDHPDALVKTVILCKRSPIPEVSDRYFYFTASNGHYIPVIKRDSEGRLINDQI